MRVVAKPWLDATAHSAAGMARVDRGVCIPPGYPGARPWLMRHSSSCLSLTGRCGAAVRAACGGCQCKREGVPANAEAECSLDVYL